jgi:hypothetical protein
VYYFADVLWILTANDVPSALFSMERLEIKILVGSTHWASFAFYSRLL